MFWKKISTLWKKHTKNLWLPVLFDIWIDESEGGDSFFLHPAFVFFLINLLYRGIDNNTIINSQQKTKPWSSLPNKSSLSCISIICSTLTHLHMHTRIPKCLPFSLSLCHSIPLTSCPSLSLSFCLFVVE